MRDCNPPGGNPPAGGGPLPYTIWQVAYAPASAKQRPADGRNWVKPVLVVGAVTGGAAIVAFAGYLIITYWWVPVLAF
jgi:hypothetical protein